MFRKKGKKCTFFEKKYVFPAELLHISKFIRNFAPDFETDFEIEGYYPTLNKDY